MPQCRNNSKFVERG